MDRQKAIEGSRRIREAMDQATEGKRLLEEAGLSDLTVSQVDGPVRDLKRVVEHVQGALNG